jgi:glutaredoxin 3
VPRGALDALAMLPVMDVPPRVRVFTSEACSFCVRAKNLLLAKGVAFEEVYLPRHDVESRVRLVQLTGRYTFPQIVVGETPIGGYDELKALDEAGRLGPLLGAR